MNSQLVRYDARNYGVRNFELESIVLLYFTIDLTFTAMTNSLK